MNRTVILLGEYALSAASPSTCLRSLAFAPRLWFDIDILRSSLHRAGGAIRPTTTSRPRRPAAHPLLTQKIPAAAVRRQSRAGSKRAPSGLAPPRHFPSTYPRGVFLELAVVVGKFALQKRSICTSLKFVPLWFCVTCTLSTATLLHELDVTT